MNFRRLEYFHVLAKLGNMHKASELLHVSPSALSKAMKNLEEELGVSLWIREGKMLRLTDVGLALLYKTNALIDELGQLKESLLDRQKVAPLKIGTFEVFSTYFLSFMKQFDQNISLELHELLPGEIEKYCESKQIDFGITYMPIPHSSLDYLKVCSIEMGVYARKGCFENLSPQELPFVVPVMPLQGVPTKVRGLDGWPEDAYERSVKHRVTLMESALELCRQGLVVGYFPNFIVREHNKRVSDEFQLERRKTPYPGRICSSDVFIVKRKSMEENIWMKKLAKALRLICR
ncbi:MAG: LysR family transcriptional regulator [Oligoflexia bacterium]|nr:LysR family transcriptional regulator [Oligoflexia bacterium]